MKIASCLLFMVCFLFFAESTLEQAYRVISSVPVCYTFTQSSAVSTSSEAGDSSSMNISFYLPSDRVKIIYVLSSFLVGRKGLDSTNGDFTACGFPVFGPMKYLLSLSFFIPEAGVLWGWTLMKGTDSIINSRGSWISLFVKFISIDLPFGVVFLWLAALVVSRIRTCLQYIGRNESNATYILT